MNRTSVGALVAIPILVGATLLGSGSAGATPLSAGAAPNAAAIGASAPAASGAAYSDGTYIVQMIHGDEGQGGQEVRLHDSGRDEVRVLPHRVPRQRFEQGGWGGKAL